MNEATTDDLEAAIGDPGIVIVSGLAIAIRPLEIQQLPKASRLAAELFGDPSITFDRDDFLLTLEDRHIGIMQELVLLMTDVKKEDINFPVSDFIFLFNAVLNFNEDFFLLAIRKARPVPVGLTSSSASEATDTPALSA